MQNRCGKCRENRRVADRGAENRAPFFVMPEERYEKRAGQRMEKSFSVGGETERDAVSHIERRVWRSGGRSVETERDGVPHGTGLV